MKLVWSPAAAEDLLALVDYIEYELDSPHAAKNIYDTILKKAELFASVPGSGIVLKTRSGFDTGYQYIICDNWMVFFSCEGEEALVVRILYGKSDYMRILFGGYIDEL